MNYYSLTDPGGLKAEFILLADIHSGQFNHKAVTCPCPTSTLMYAGQEKFTGRQDYSIHHYVSYPPILISGYIRHRGC